MEGPVARIPSAISSKTNGEVKLSRVLDGVNSLNRPRDESLPIDVKLIPGTEKAEKSNWETAPSTRFSMAANPSEVAYEERKKNKYTETIFTMMIV